jgi:ABC-type lipoprotein release transport system permease subunit
VIAAGTDIGKAGIMHTTIGSPARLSAGLYAWACGIFFGATLLDTRYAGIVGDVLSPSQTSAAFSSVSDLLLVVGAVTMLSALASFIPARNASWPTVREVLAYE